MELSGRVLASGHKATLEGPKVDRADFSIAGDVAQSIKESIPSAFQREVCTYTHACMCRCNGIFQRTMSGHVGEREKKEKQCEGI